MDDVGEEEEERVSPSSFLWRMGRRQRSTKRRRGKERGRPRNRSAAAAAAASGRCKTASGAAGEDHQFSPQLSLMVHLMRGSQIHRSGEP